MRPAAPGGRRNAWWCSRCWKWSIARDRVAHRCYRRPKPKPLVDMETHSVCIGPLELDVHHARMAGWSERLIARVGDTIVQLGKRAYATAHRAGPIPTCPCIACDRRFKTAELDDEYRRVRERWAR